MNETPDTSIFVDFRKTTKDIMGCDWTFSNIEYWYQPLHNDVDKCLFIIYGHCFYVVKLTGYEEEP